MTTLSAAPWRYGKGSAHEYWLRGKPVVPPREKRKRQARWLAILVLLIALGVFAYHTGSVLARREVVNLRAELAQMLRTADDLRH